MVFGTYGTQLLSTNTVETGQTKYIFPADDTWGPERELLTLEQQVVVAGMKEKKTARLAGKTKVAIGMKTMVTWNIATDADLANGAWGQIVDIVLDPSEEDTSADENNVRVLKYPPGMVIFKPISDTVHHIPGLKNSLIQLTIS